MSAPHAWVRLVSVLVPSDERADWIEEWHGELVASGGSMTHAWGALADAWYLRTEGWTMEGLLRDVRTAVRGLVRKPLFTVVAGLTLAVGIAANTAIFTVVDGVLLNPLPFPDPEELVSYLFREATFPAGCYLLTGTGIVPDAEFTLKSGDVVTITIEPIGTLENTVR